MLIVVLTGITSITQVAIASTKQAKTPAIKLPTPQAKYTNKKYKFSLSYPKSYIKNKGYATYDANYAVFNGYAWGINKGQENLFIIDVYSKKSKEKVLKYIQLSISKEKVKLNNKITANIIKSNDIKYGYFVSRGNYIYIIHSSLIESQEFQKILLSLRISG